MAFYQIGLTSFIPCLPLDGNNREPVSMELLLACSPGCRKVG